MDKQIKNCCRCGNNFDDIIKSKYCNKCMQYETRQKIAEEDYEEYCKEQSYKSDILQYEKLKIAVMNYIKNTI